MTFVVSLEIARLAIRVHDARAAHLAHAELQQELTDRIRAHLAAAEGMMPRTARETRGERR